MANHTHNRKKYSLIALILLFPAALFFNTGFSYGEQNHTPSLALSGGDQTPHLTDPNFGAGDDGNEEGDDEEGGSTEPTDVIRNGGFEARDSDPMVGVALEWEAYNNGQAHFGWYDETWPEAVNSGEHAQLLEIFQVDGNILDRAVAVYQTVNVVPNAQYDLTINALMRSDAPESLRNQDEYEMSWGIDYSGAESYDNVDEWVFMPLTEQLRVGSNGDVPDNNSLFYETITGTVETGDNSRLTLFIRGVKKFPNGTEVNFDIDDVSLVGPTGSVVVIQPEPDDSGTTSDDDANLPVSGGNPPQNLSVGALILGGLIIVVLGTGATANLLLGRDET